MSKVPVSFEWLSGCSGCEMSTVDLHDRLLDVLDEIELVRIPILMDEKDYPKATLGIVTGALRTDHDVHAAHEMRKSCDKILAFGVCAVYGGPQGSAYAHRQGELEAAVFEKNPTTRTNFIPDQGVPRILPEGVRPIDSEIEVEPVLARLPASPLLRCSGVKVSCKRQGSGIRRAQRVFSMSPQHATQRGCCPAAFSRRAGGRRYLPYVAGNFVYGQRHPGPVPRTVSATWNGLYGLRRSIGTRHFGAPT